MYSFKLFTLDTRITTHSSPWDSESSKVRLLYKELDISEVKLCGRRLFGLAEEDLTGVLPCRPVRSGEVIHQQLKRNFGS